MTCSYNFFRCFAAAATLATALAAQAGAQCSQPAVEYEREAYTVRAVEVNTLLPAAKPAAPALAGQQFTLAAWQQGQRDVAAAGGRKGLRLVVPSITDCDAASKTLVVAYRLIAIPDLTGLLKLRGLRAPSVLAFNNAAVGPAPRCLNLGVGLPIKNLAGPNYTYTASFLADSCGPLAFRNTIQLYRPSITSSYTIHPGKTTFHDFDTAAAAWAGPVVFDGRITSTAPGGQYAVRFSAGAPVWRRPLVPRSVWRHGGLASATALALTAARSALQDSYLAESADFKEIASELAAVRAILASVPPPAARTKAKATLQLALSRLNTALASELSPAQVRGLAIDFDAGTGLAPVPALLTTLARELRRQQAKNPELTPAVARLENALYGINERFRRLETSKDALRAAQRARGEMKDAERLLHSLLERGSLYAVSPVFLMTAASQRSLAIGGGARLTLLAVDVTVGYTWNVDPGPGRPRSAWTAAFDLTHLFR